MATGEGLKEKCEDNNNNNTEKKIEKVLNKVKGPAPAIDGGCKVIIPSAVHEEVSPGSQTVKNFDMLAKLRNLMEDIHLGNLGHAIFRFLMVDYLPQSCTIQSAPFLGEPGSWDFSEPAPH